MLSSLSVNCLLRTHSPSNLLVPVCNQILVRLNSTNQSLEANPEGEKNLKRDVINLYKNLIYLSREWPTDLRPQIKRAFLKNKDVKDESEIQSLIGRGEYVCREIIATYHLRKYRAMKRRYYSDSREKELEEMFKNYSN